MRKIRDVLRLKLDARLSHEKIARSLGISEGVVVTLPRFHVQQLTQPRGFCRSKDEVITLVDAN